MSDEVMRAIGRLEGKLDALTEASKSNSLKLEGIDGRLRSVETRSATYGTAGGTIAGVGISLLVAAIREKLGLQ